MFERIKSLFQSQKPRLYYIEINDSSIDYHISKMIVKVKKEIKTFKEHLSVSNMSLKDEDLNNLYSLMLSVREEVSRLKDDVDKITNMELNNKEHFIIKDKSFLEDKKEQLSTILDSIDKFTQIVKQKPSAEDFKKELLDDMFKQLDVAMASMDKIVKDDFDLRRIYKRLMEI